MLSGSATTLAGGPPPYEAVVQIRTSDAGTAQQLVKQFGGWVLVVSGRRTMHYWRLGIRSGPSHQLRNALSCITGQQHEHVAQALRSLDGEDQSAAQLMLLLDSPLVDSS
jgi:hypothetical protein